jgi:hypothetical protein
MRRRNINMKAGYKIGAAAARRAGRLTPDFRENGLNLRRNMEFSSTAARDECIICNQTKARCISAGLTAAG